MTPAATETTTTTTTAADAAVAASTAATDAPKPATDTAAGSPPPADQWKAPENKDAFDKIVGDAVAAEAAKYAAPEKYEIKLPDEIKVDTAIVEKTAAIARELGLSQDNAQKTLTFVASEVATQVAAHTAAWTPPSKENNNEGGALWREQEEGWRASSLADKDLGNGKPEQLKSVTDGAKQVVAKFGDEKLIEFFETSGLGSNPATLRFLHRIKQSMSEGSLVIGDRTTNREDSESAKAERIYDHPTSKKK